MGRGLASLLIVLACAGCTAGPSKTGATVSPSSSPVALTYKVVVQKIVLKPCVPAPDVSVVISDDEWINTWDEETTCVHGSDVMLPDADFTRDIALVARWPFKSCLPARVSSLERNEDKVVLTVDATPSPCPSPAHGTNVGQSETFLTVARADVCDVTEFEFRMNERRIGTTAPSAPISC